MHSREWELSLFWMLEIVVIGSRNVPMSLWCTWWSLGITRGGWNCVRKTKLKLWNHGSTLAKKELSLENSACNTEKERVRMQGETTYTGKRTTHILVNMWGRHKSTTHQKLEMERQRQWGTYCLEGTQKQVKILRKVCDGEVHTNWRVQRKGGVRTANKSKWARDTHFLWSAEERTNQYNKRKYMSKWHWLSGEHRGRDKSGQWKKVCKRGPPTDWRVERLGQDRTTKESEQVRGTHLLESVERRTS